MDFGSSDAVISGLKANTAASPTITIIQATQPDKIPSKIAFKFGFRTLNCRYKGTARQTVAGFKKYVR